MSACSDCAYENQINLQQSQANEAARWEAIRQLNDPAQWNQKAPPLPLPVKPKRFDCYTNGAYTTCQ